jgi:hypothetical protein
MAKPTEPPMNRENGTDDIITPITLYGVTFWTTVEYRGSVKPSPRPVNAEMPTAYGKPVEILRVASNPVPAAITMMPLVPSIL